jgi:hypothetical protein
MVNELIDRLIRSKDVFRDGGSQGFPGVDAKVGVKVEKDLITLLGRPCGSENQSTGSTK